MLCACMSRSVTSGIAVVGVTSDGDGSRLPRLSTRQKHSLPLGASECRHSDRRKQVLSMSEHGCTRVTCSSLSSSYRSVWRPIVSEVCTASYPSTNVICVTRDFEGKWREVSLIMEACQGQSPILRVISTWILYRPQSLEISQYGKCV